MIEGQRTITHEIKQPTWVGQVVSAWDLGVCSSSSSHVHFLSGANLGGLV